MYIVETALRRAGGIARASELIAVGIDPEILRLAVDYGRVDRLRKGWYAVRDLDPDLRKLVASVAHSPASARSSTTGFTMGMADSTWR